GAYMRSRIAAFEEATGIKQASGGRLSDLDRLQNLAFDLVKIVELEKSGIRDGDGYWHGSDPLGATINDLNACWQIFRRRDQQECNGRAPPRPSAPLGGIVRDADDQVPF